MLATLRFGPSTVSQPLRKLDMVANDVEVDWSHAPILSPDGARIAYLSKNRIWIRDLTQLTPRAVADVASSTPIGWSPDSRALVFAEAKKLWKVPVEAGSPTAICELPGTGNITGVTWSRSGVIALAVWRGGLYTVAAGGGAAKLLVDIDPATTVDFHASSWLANGDLLYVTHWTSEQDSSGQRRAFFTVFDGKQQIPVVGDFGGADFSAIVAPTGEFLFLRGDPSPGLWSVPFDMARHRVDGTPVLVAPGTVSVSVSEDGSLLYVEGSGGEERRDLARGTETRLTFGGDWEGRPEWLASSSRLAYARVKKFELESRLFAVNADGSGGQREFAPAAGLGASDPSFNIASDGKWAVRIVDARGTGRLRVGPVLPDGSLGGLRPLLRLEPEPDIHDASISADGKLLAYVTNDPRQAVDRFLTRFPEGVGQWQVGTEGGRTPRDGLRGGRLRAGPAARRGDASL